MTGPAFMLMTNWRGKKETVIKNITRKLREAKSVLFITGAGLSADSGLPTYRGAGGLYENLSTEDNMPIEEALSGAMFKKAPHLTWKYLMEIERKVTGAQPNTAHGVIAAFEREIERVWVLTQNIDGLHQKAGSRNVLEIHGNLHSLKCTRCGKVNKVNDFSSFHGLPACLECSGMLRPDVVLFGELLPLEKLSILRREMKKGFDICFSIGTSSMFPYIQSPIMEIAREGGFSVEVNPGQSGISHLVDYHLKIRAAEALKCIWEEYKE